MKAFRIHNRFLRAAFPAVTISVILLILCGVIYPLTINGLAAWLFPHQASGSLVYADGKPVGSAIIGQDFTAPYFMKCRPSAYHYNTFRQDSAGTLRFLDGSEFTGLASGSANYAPSNPALVKRVEADINALLAANPGVLRSALPADIVTASGSGLDPHISPAAAWLQVPAIARASGIDAETLRNIVKANTTNKLLGIFGERTVNVLKVNLEIARRMGLVREIR
ncbi:MAG: potassium-transporting ATPase subunit KdpC [Candidatus Spyradenecus sp.]